MLRQKKHKKVTALKSQEIQMMAGLWKEDNLEGLQRK
jgi:hypothetical protein